ncbi:MAG: hypothetical protein HRT72_12340, partial [Flavobacteriales bacterium]|nr:hypothetical protein [Flavobacteriales bacterium]
SGSSYSIVFGLSNTGKSVAKYPMFKIKVNGPYKFSQFGIGGGMSTGLDKEQEQSNGSTVYVGKPGQVIHPGIVLQIDQLEIDVDKSSGELPPLKIEYTAIAEGMLEKSETMTYKFNV